ncbi:adenylate/guanylate cyclase domain-containing protein [Qipengyuania flava]|uniref:adenylate/guanylate cyclase domain-containing protein n=1 Tax=Qipengyuania flava TaxID=192812 RepID=UPI0012903015|nr:adenylate/guanylate cyclase domain-containing protein [Qipengyuania flava]
MAPHFDVKWFTNQIDLAGIELATYWRFLGPLSEAIIEERRRAAKTVRYALGLAIALLVGTIVHTILNFEPEVGSTFTLWALALIGVLAGWIWWIGTPHYPRLRAADLVFSIPMIFLMDRLRDTLSYPMMREMSIQPSVTLMGNALLLIVFIWIVFRGNFVGLVIWAFIHATHFSVTLFQMDESLPALIQSASVYAPVLLLLLYGNYSLLEEGLENFRLRQELAEEKQKSEALLYNLLPEEVAERLRRGESVADAYSDATVLFVDLVGSSAIARQLSPKSFVQMLGRVFAVADACAVECGVERIKTLGDAYLAISGAKSGGDAENALRFAILLLERMDELSGSLDLELSLRIGIHSGPVVGGVIGQHRAGYDYWGDTMNVAARIQAVAHNNSICVSEPTYFATRSFVDYAPRRLTSLKGIGEVAVYDSFSTSKLLARP